MNGDDLYFAWRKFKNLFQWTHHIPPTLFHFIYGIVIFAVVYLVLRRFRWAPIYAWLAVCVLEGINEVIDVGFDIYRYDDIRVKSTAMDIVATLAIPTLLAGYMLWRRKLKWETEAPPQDM